jgi:hypothetical protein
MRTAARQGASLLLCVPLLLAACTRSSERADQVPVSPPAITAPTPAATAATPATLTTPATAADWMVTPTGSGPVRIGMTVVEARQALGGQLTPLGPTGPCHYLRSASAPPDLAFMVIDNHLARVDVANKAVATTAGARIGDSEARIKTLYPQVEVTPHKYVKGHYLTVLTDNGEYGIVFETDGQRVTRYRAGRMPEVGWIEGCS